MGQVILAYSWGCLPFLFLKVGVVTHIHQLKKLVVSQNEKSELNSYK